MERHLDEELKDVKRRLLEMADLAIASIRKAIRAVKERKVNLVNEIFEIDRRIDEFEIENEEKCIELLALRQPVGTDLRFLVGAIKINNELERMGDHAVNIGQCALALAEKPQLKPLIDIPKMARLATEMLKDSINSFIENDAVKAKKVCERDDRVDELRDQIFRELLTYMMSDPTTIPRAMELILVSRNVERIADLSTNICEEVIYIAQARVIKHHAEEKGRTK
jgi:phosphate transport system protein